MINLLNCFHSSSLLSICYARVAFRHFLLHVLAFGNVKNIFLRVRLLTGIAYDNCLDVAKTK